MARIQRWAVLLAALGMLGCGDDGTTGSVQDASGSDADAGTEDLGGGGPDAEPDTPQVDAEPVEADPDPGRVTLHRLNRAEYNNTVRDLLGTALTPADDFPADDHGYGFDNIADVLSMSPLLFELAENAASQLIEEALHVPPAEPEVFYWEAEDCESTTGGPTSGGWNVWSNGKVYATATLPADGTYKIEARVWGQQAGPDLVQAALLVDNLPVWQGDVASTSASPEVLTVETELTAGAHEFGVAFLNDFYEPELGNDRNLIVDWFVATGPMEAADASPVNPIREALLVCQETTKDCAREVVASFVARAWRRAVETDEVDRLMALYDLAVGEGADWDEALSIPLRAVLISPHFLFRVELDADPTDTEPHLLGAYELASRLSYFVWSSMPDELLLEAAASGALLDPEVLKTQTQRMLADPKADALVDNFAGQWLYLRALHDAFPDVWAYPAWNAELQDSMAAEAYAFVSTFIRGGRPLSELLTSTTSFVDATLATFYGLDPGPDGLDLLPGELREVDVSGVHRGGFLRQAGILATLSYPTRTSPVKRGKWVLEQLLCQEPPPPPPGVEGLVTDTADAKTLREILEAHRADPECAGCHALMDPIGLGLENFDGIGTYRTEDNGFAIDPSGKLPGNKHFETADELVEVLAAEPSVPGCISEKLFTYGLGRGPTHADEPYLEAIAEHFVSHDWSFEELVLAVVTSDPFRMRRGEAASDSDADSDQDGGTP